MSRLFLISLRDDGSLETDTPFKQLRVLAESGSIILDGPIEIKEMID